MQLDSFNAHWKKVLGTVSCILQVFGRLYVLAFISYETQGHAAHFWGLMTDDTRQFCYISSLILVMLIQRGRNLCGI